MCSEGGVMRRTVFCLSFVWLTVAIVACGNGDGKETDVADQGVFEVAEIIEEDGTIQPTNCVGMDGEPCFDGDPCKIGEGVCLADDCFYEDNQILVCDTPPDECSESAGCSPDGCLWQLAEGFCQIDDKCVTEGTKNPGN